jgi:enoyl-CoA hydratase/carnithine racemase
VTDQARRLSVAIEDSVAHLRIERPAKRNALDDATIEQIRCFFESPPDVRVAIIEGAGAHFSAGLDLSEQLERSAIDVVAHSHGWHKTFEAIEFGQFPVISVLRGACIGGGLELAAATHVRVAERSAFFALPEAQRAIFVGGGGSVRVSRLMGTSRMLEMMLTGRTYNAAEAERLSLVHYVVDDGAGLAFARELAGKIAANSAWANFAVLHALPRIAGMSSGDGLFTESVVAALMQTSPEARERISAFLTRKKGIA